MSESAQDESTVGLAIDGERACLLLQFFQVLFAHLLQVAADFTIGHHGTEVEVAQHSLGWVGLDFLTLHLLVFFEVLLVEI